MNKINAISTALNTQSLPYTLVFSMQNAYVLGWELHTEI